MHLKVTYDLEVLFSRSVDIFLGWFDLLHEECTLVTAEFDNERIPELIGYIQFDDAMFVSSESTQSHD